MFNIEEELKKLPDKPGVYIMHDAQDAIIYVGKAVSLKNRVRQYFQKRIRSPKIERMISLIDHFEYVVVGSEMEALVLECNLIKENHPKYNTMLMDDKTYPFIKVTTGEPYPRVYMTRNHERDKAKYFGPYTNVTAAKELLDLLKKLYRVRSCNRRLDTSGQDKPCLYFHMKQCDGPCAGKISVDEYRKQIDEVVKFLDGDSANIRKSLTLKMQEAAANMEFEKAAEYRDLINDIHQISEVQRVTNENSDDRDVIGLATAGDEAVVQVFFIRGGKMTGREHFYLTGVENENRPDVLNEFVKQFYAEIPTLPKELILSEDIPEAELISDYLTDRAGVRIRITSPKRGDKMGLVKLACTNASTVLQKDTERLVSERKATLGALEELAKLMDIPLPRRIESYDISNISGFESVGSMVVYEDGKPKRSDYRKFRIRTVQGANDYASLAEVLTRRFTHASKNPEVNDSFSKYPDLIMMDGGRGQVNIATEVFDNLGINIRVCGMVKDDNHRTRGIYYNNVEIPIDTRGEAFKLTTRIQDETHRFAIEYHRSLRSKDQVKSILDDIEGIGPTRRRALMRHFESIEAVRNASVEELANAESMNLLSAQAVYDFFHKET